MLSFGSMTRSFVVPMIALALAAGCDRSTARTGNYTAPAPLSGAGGADPATGEVRYLALGDSLTQGGGLPDMEKGAFPTLLAQKWREKGCKVELKNPAVTRFEAKDVIAKELPLIESFKPTLITFQIGSNDVAMKVPIATYRANIQTILDAAKKSGARVLVMPQNEWFRSPEGTTYGKDLAERRASFDAVLMEEATARGAEVVDLRLLFQQQADKKMWNADDHMHPNAEAYAAWATEIARVLPSPCVRR